jgi:hypothetical protein
MLFLGENKYDLISYMIYFGCILCEYMQSKINSIMQMRLKIFGKGRKQYLHQPQKQYFMFLLEKYIRQARKPHTSLYRPVQAHTGPYRPIQARAGTLESLKWQFMAFSPGNETLSPSACNFEVMRKQKYSLDRKKRLKSIYHFKASLI